MFDFDPDHPNPPLEIGTQVALRNTSKTKKFKFPQTAQIAGRSREHNYFTYSIKGIGKNGEELKIDGLLRTDFDTVS